MDLKFKEKIAKQLVNKGYIKKANLDDDLRNAIEKEYKIKIDKDWEIQMPSSNNFIELLPRLISKPNEQFEGYLQNKEDAPFKSSEDMDIFFHVDNDYKDEYPDLGEDLENLDELPKVPQELLDKFVKVINKFIKNKNK